MEPTKFYSKAFKISLTTTITMFSLWKIRQYLFNNKNV